MTNKYALFAFNGDPMCFIHVILNALDMKDKGFDVKVIVEGSACKLAGEFENESNPFFKKYQELKNSGLIDCFCKACSGKLGSLEKVKKIGFPTCNEMMGHPSMAKYIQKGYEIITF
ncbi:MAG: cytoplasmic protein [Candidatus Lokiarchaeota archaeon]|nr:cytoplasmic protein [Candidatus Lokiarchaeota archaeon]MBD3339300.1 cytoplasmic protein [Candidatus Lokiarchaeota archaeon]